MSTAASDYLDRLTDTMAMDAVQVASCRTCGKEHFGFRVWPAAGDQDIIEHAIAALDRNRAARRMPLYLYAVSPPDRGHEFTGSEPCEVWDTAARRMVTGGTFLACMEAVTTPLCLCDSGESAS